LTNIDARIIITLIKINKALPMKIKIISAYNEKMKALSDLSFRATEEFCEKHGFDCERYKIVEYDRPASWYKIKVILECLDQNYDFLLWIDADAIILNKNFNLKSLIKTDKNFYISKDLNTLNFGVFLARKNEFSKDLFEKIYSMTEYINHAWWEQAALIDLYNLDYNNIQSKTELVPQNTLNAYEYQYYGFDRSHDGQIDSNSFIAHFPALPLDSRLFLMKKYITQYRVFNSKS
jgi:hypothetical protein